MIENEILRVALVLAGVGQVVLVVASAMIPKCLGWQRELAPANRLLRQIFWTYAGYILGVHAFFGLVSTWAPDELLDGSKMATALTGLMALWWGLRMGLQFFAFDRSCIPRTRFNGIAECGLVGLFVFNALVYGLSFWRNLG